MTLKTPGGIPHPPIPFPSVPTAWPGFPSPSGRRLTALELAYLQVFRSPREDTGLHLRPHIFDFSGKAVRQHWAHISTWAQMAGAK